MRKYGSGLLVAHQSSASECCKEAGPSRSLVGRGAVHDPPFFFQSYVHDHVVQKKAEGPKSAFTVGPQAARATLDSIRAVLQSTSFSNISRHARAAMWGYSGGALASEWAAEFIASYALELTWQIVGVAAGGLTPNVSSVILTVNKGASAALIPIGLNGFGQAYPNMSAYLATHLIPSTAAASRAPLSSCLDQVGASFACQDIFAYFKTAGKDS